jgi:hypothetical protein
MAIEIVDLPIKNGDFPCFLYVYQRVRVYKWDMFIAMFDFPRLQTHSPPRFHLAQPRDP